MPMEPRIRQLLEDALDSGRSPDEVCQDCPELLEDVRRQWLRLCGVEAQMGVLFPTTHADAAGTADCLTADLPQVEGYDVESVLGSGGMGVVYRAHHRKLNRPVALKTILAGSGASRAEKLRFQREAEAVAALRHPNVVQVYDSGEAGGRPYFTMELMGGGTLAEKVAGTPLPVRTAVDYVVTLAGAVEAAHILGIVHRDLKPANVLLAEDGTPKITDFGVARHVAADAGLTLTGTRVGTPSYMAPEQALGLPHDIGPAADVYALGAILYELLTGRPPFKGESAAETERQVIAQDPVSPSRLNAKVPFDLATVCLKCLEKEPHRRYTSAASLAEDLGRFQRGEPILARPAGLMEKVQRWIRRNPMGASLIAAMTALIAVGIAMGIRELGHAADRRAELSKAGARLERAVQLQGEGRYAEARAVLDQASDGGSKEVSERIESARAELKFAERLDGIRLNRVDQVWSDANLARADAAYENAFREEEIYSVQNSPEVVASRLRPLSIREPLIAALDDWALCIRDVAKSEWVRKVVQQVDGESPSWRGRARDPVILSNSDTLLELASTAPVSDRSVALLLAIAQRLEDGKHDPLPLLTRLQQAHPTDFWTNYVLANRLREKGRPNESLRYYQAALSIRPATSAVYTNLGLSLMLDRRHDEASWHFSRALEIDPSNTPAFGNIGIILAREAKHDEAIKRLRLAIQRSPKYPVFHMVLGHSLEAQGQHSEALDQFREAIAIDPKSSVPRREIRTYLLRNGRLNEALAAWAEALTVAPPEHQAWYGYAELCLYLGRTDDYHKARHDLLSRFGETTDPIIAERVARACLLLPGADEQQQQASALAELAVREGRSMDDATVPFFLFVQGLAEYRLERHDRAIALMHGDASKILGPCPGLVLAMALYRTGQHEEARKNLAAAIDSYDWSATDVSRDHHPWICHILRREARAMIQPKDPASLPPQDR